MGNSTHVWLIMPKCKQSQHSSALISPSGFNPIPADIHLGKLHFVRIFDGKVSVTL